MVTDTQQTHFNLIVICEGLKAIASSSEVQLLLNKKGLVHLEDVFDPMPLDYISWLEDKNEISANFASQFRRLYEEMESELGHLELHEQDAFISQNNQELQHWRKIAGNLLGEINCI